MIEKNLKQQYHISLKEFYVLYEIYKSDDKKLNINDLIKTVNLSQSAMSRLINRLESEPHKLIKREECGKDRRITYFHLTENGSDLTIKLIDEYRKLIKKVNIEHIEELISIVKTTI
ncbi:MarR family transcriptional regulator [Staphylococcus sp. GSSP0090]|nr:MarR family transcriptional regulator [Staphylococcus sp. GSSP0090]